jgi:hypothetical protein
MKLGHRTLLAGALLFASAAPVSAESIALGGRSGVGADTTLAGGNLMHFRSWVTPQIGLEGLLGFERHSSDGGSTSTLLLGFELLYALAGSGGSHVGAFGGLGFERFGLSFGGFSGSETFFILQGGLYAEQLFTRHFALHGKLGLVILLNGATVLDFFGGNDVVGTAGFTFYF